MELSNLLANWARDKRWIWLLWSHGEIVGKHTFSSDCAFCETRYLSLTSWYASTYGVPTRYAGFTQTDPDWMKGTPIAKKCIASPGTCFAGQDIQNLKLNEHPIKDFM